MHKKFEVNWTKIKGGCQSERKVSQLNSYSKMPLTQKRIENYPKKKEVLSLRCTQRKKHLEWTKVDLLKIKILTSEYRCWQHYS